MNKFVALCGLILFGIILIAFPAYARTPRSAPAGDAAESAAAQAGLIQSSAPITATSTPDPAWQTVPGVTETLTLSYTVNTAVLDTQPLVSTTVPAEAPEDLPADFSPDVTAVPNPAGPDAQSKALLPASAATNRAADACLNVVNNSGFEYDGGWYEYPASNIGPSYYFPYAGLRSAYVSSQNLTTASAVLWQPVAIPAGAGDLLLQLQSGLRFYDSGEMIYFRVYDASFSVLLYSDFLIYPTADSWYTFQAALPPELAGQTVIVSIELVQDYDLIYSEVYFDDVILAACDTGGDGGGGQPSTPTDMGFRPNPDGFSFENYADAGSMDLGPNDMVRLFGRDAVCANSAGACALTAAASAWRQAQIQGMQGGHCYGMAAGSLRFFKGLDQPNTLQPGAQSAFDLQKNTAVQAYIAYYFVMQGLTPVGGTQPLLRTGVVGPPSQVLNELQQAFQSGADPYLLGFFKSIPFNSPGHAVTPYALEDRGGGLYRLYIYDNNAPNADDRYFEIDVNQERWRYEFGTPIPGQPADVWEGSGTTNPLLLYPLSAHDQRWECPFCNVAQTNGIMNVSYGSEGRIQVIDPNGQRIGYDAATGQYVNEIPAATELSLLSGFGREIPPTYQLPLAGQGAYTVILSGDGRSEESAADLVLTRPDYVLGFSNVRLDPDEEIRVTISADGRQLTFEGNADGETPALFIATTPGGDGVSYDFAVSGVQITAGSRVTLTLDPDNGRLYFGDDDDAADQYDFDIHRIDAGGRDVWFVHRGVVLDGPAAGYLDYDAWSGDDPLPVVIDDEGNGFDDDTAVELENQVVHTHLPIVVFPGVTTPKPATTFD